MLLFDVYKNRLFGYVLAITHSPYIAEEITQEVFLKLWLNRLELDKIDNPDAYIFAIARNKTLNYLRKANYDKKLLREIELTTADTLNNDVEERQAVSECDGLLEKAITQLSPQRKQVYRLSRKEGLNHVEIARQLNISRNTVKNHLVETLRFIRKYLHKNGILLLLAGLFSAFKNSL
ncbi:MAG: RNA polymerase sigma-70 factor [Chitinophagaceae bacterium]|nr:RNA polymerase sigma-70 factor [Chitinophagaceae bacterium]